MIPDRVDAPVGAGRDRTRDEPVGIVDEDLHANRSTAERRRSVPPVVFGLAQEERSTSTVNPTTLPRFHSSGHPKRLGVPLRRCGGIRHR